MDIKSPLIFTAITVALFFISCASATVTPIKITQSGDKVIIEVKNYRITEKIVSDEKTELYLAYGVAGLVGDCTAILNLLPYDKAKQLVQQYGDIGNCKTASGQAWQGSMYDIKCYASNADIENTIKRIAGFKRVPVIKMKYRNLGLIEWVKKKGNEEIKYKQVMESYPHYLITDIEIIDEEFDINKL